MTRSVRHPSSSSLRCPWELHLAPGGGILIPKPRCGSPPPRARPPVAAPLRVHQATAAVVVVLAGQIRAAPSSSSSSSRGSFTPTAVAASSSPSARRQSRPRPTYTTASRGLIPAARRGLILAASRGSSLSPASCPRVVARQGTSSAPPSRFGAPPLLCSSVHPLLLVQGSTVSFCLLIAAA